MLKLFESTADKSSRHSRFAIFLFIVLLIVSPLIGYWTYKQQMDVQEAQVRDSLSRIAGIRADMISSFIHERIGDAQVATSSPFIKASVASWLHQGYKNDRLRAQILQRLSVLKKIYGYTEVAIVDLNGNILLTTENSVLATDDIARQAIERAALSNTIQVTSIQSASAATGRRVIDIAAPLLQAGESGSSDVLLLLRFDPQRQIYPALQYEPFPNLPNDTLLVEVRGQQVVSLSNARISSYRYLDPIPVNQLQLQASATVPEHYLTWQTPSGKTEIGAAHAIGGTSWFVMAMVDEHAVRAMGWDTIRVAIMTSAAMFCLLCIGILFWWKYKQSEYKLAALKTETKGRLLQEKYDYLSKFANDMIILTNADSIILEVNDKVQQVFGYPALSLVGQPFVMLTPLYIHDQLKADLNGLHCDGAALFQTDFQRRDGTVFPTEISARSIGFDGQAYSQFICRDITERKEAERKIQFLAYYDSVTSLPNRTLLNDRLDQAVHMAMRSSKRVGVLFLDLDNFKNTNDSLGHQVGDMLLSSVGERLQSCVRQEDTVARIGGDEFMIVLPDLERGEEARHVAEKVIASIAKPFLLQEQQVYTTTSIGISLFPDDSKKMQDLVKYADSALYQAKRQGRNTYYFFTKALNDQITRGSKIEQRLRDAMDAGDLCLWYQPQIDVRSGKLIGAEALLRWRDGSPEYFTPTDFIAVAEERGLIAKLGEWTLREACGQCRQWQKKGLGIVPVAVNVSPIQLQQKEFAELVLSILDDAGLDASFLELEITETSIMRSEQMVADLAMRLRDSGVRISIDDFGTGYSSLSFLKHIPIDKIKIDRSFVMDMLSDAEDQTITQTIVRLGQSLQLRVIAEGVESRAQMKQLLSLGCHEAQGYLYSRAVSSEAFQAFLEEDWRFAVVEEPEAA